MFDAYTYRGEENTFPIINNVYCEINTPYYHQLKQYVIYIMVYANTIINTFILGVLEILCRYQVLTFFKKYKNTCFKKYKWIFLFGKSSTSYY